MYDVYTQAPGLIHSLFMVCSSLHLRTLLIYYDMIRIEILQCVPGDYMVIIPNKIWNNFKTIPSCPIILSIHHLARYIYSFYT